MKSRDDSLTLVGMIWRNLRRQRLRTSLTILGVSVGVIAIVSLAGLVRGLWSATDAAIRSGDVDVMVYQKDVSLDILSRLDEAATRATLARIPEVAQVTAGILHVVRVGDRPYVILLGVRRDELNTRELVLAAGRPFETEEEVLVGTVLARELDVGVGDTVEIRGRTFRVTGIFVSDIIFFAGGVMMPLASTQELVGMEGQVMYLRIKVRDGVEPADVAARIERENDTLTAITGVAEYKKVDLGLEIADDVVFIISLVATVVGAIIVLNTMWMSVFERTREIGVLRAVGWSSRKVVTMIIIESAGIGLIACVVGSVLGVGLAKLAAALPIARQFASPVFTFSIFALAMSLAVVLGVVGGAAPAWRAARISPAEALRYE